MKITLRPFETDDVYALVNNANNINIANNLTNKFPFPYLQKDGEAFIEFCNSKTPIEVKAIVSDGDVIGSIGIHPLQDIYSKSAEMGYWIGEPFWGKGLVVQAIKQMLVYGFETFDIDRVFARTTHLNIASQRVLLKSGFVFEAEFKATIFKNNRYFDERVYGYRKSQPETETQF